MAIFYVRPSLVEISSPLYKSGAWTALSDHNREEVEIDYERIENRKRMANGRMRSYFIAEKRRMSFGWSNLPSRASGPSGVGGSTRYTVDGFAGANDLKDFYETVKGSFDLKIYFDDSAATNFTSGQMEGQYAMFFTSFSLTVVKRGALFDLCNVRFSLEQE